MNEEMLNKLAEEMWAGVTKKLQGKLVHLSDEEVFAVYMKMAEIQKEFIECGKKKEQEHGQ